MQNIEQLKLILETIGQTTESAKHVLLLWLALDIGKLLVCWLGGILLAVVAARVLMRLIATSTFGGQCRDLVFPSETGTSITSTERRKVLEALRRGIEAGKNQQ